MEEIKQRIDKIEERVDKIEEIIGWKKPSINKVLVKCQYCGYTWGTKSISKRVSCPRCSGRTFKNSVE